MGTLGIATGQVNAQGENKTYTHQGLALQAALNTDPNPAKDNQSVIVDNFALTPNISPDGSSTGEPKIGRDQIATYMVKSGDNLSSIAKLFGVSVSTIRWANDIARADSIRVGQELVILPIDGVRYTIKKGDTVASIAKKYKGDVDEILNFNSLAVDDQLEAGEVIIIPDGVMANSPQTGSSNNVSKYSGPEIAGFFLRPVPGPKTQGLHGKNGVDLGGPIGTTILAAASGEVVIAKDSGYNGGYGEFVVITHSNGTQTLYGHMSEVEVSAGQYVLKGQKIGEIGSTGRSTGPHLHFEVRGAKNPF